MNSANAKDISDRNFNTELAIRFSPVGLPKLSSGDHQGGGIAVAIGVEALLKSIPENIRSLSQNVRERCISCFSGGLYVEGYCRDNLLL